LKALFALILLAGLTGQALEEKATECVGCHTAQRTIPQSRFGNGLGRWTDAHCYGCHAELNDVARMRHRRQPDPRYVAVPVREERLARMATTEPLSYMMAPERVEPPTASPPRIAWERLAAFLKRPSTLSHTGGQRAPRMMAYPDLTAQEAREAGRVLGIRQARVSAPATRLSPQERKQAETLWATRCVACHGGEQLLAGRTAVTLGIYTPEWLQAYAANKVSSPTGGERAMPEVPLDLKEARLLYRLFGELRVEAEREVDTAVEKLRLDAAPLPAQVSPDFIRHLWGSFLREATCVHCHATSPRAARAFTATEDGLRRYLREQGGAKFWSRLATRRVEARHGLVAEKPGMPMAGAPLSDETLSLIARWVLDGCRDPNGQRACKP